MVVELEGEAWNTNDVLKRRPGETEAQRLRRLRRKYPDYDETKDPFSSSYKTFNGQVEATNCRRQLQNEGRWLQDQATRFEVFPDVMCMSWRWPHWWNTPQVLTEQHHKGLPARLLQFPSGRQLWQVTTPVHGFDEPGDTLLDPKDTHKNKPQKES